MLMYEDLGRVSTLVKNAKASLTAVTNVGGRGQKIPREKLEE